MAFIFEEVEKCPGNGTLGKDKSILNTFNQTRDGRLSLPDVPDRFLKCTEQYQV